MNSYSEGFNLYIFKATRIKLPDGGEELNFVSHESQVDPKALDEIRGCASKLRFNDWEIERRSLQRIIFFSDLRGSKKPTFNSRKKIINECES